MSTRPDGMPAGHPEQVPTPIASLTLYYSSAVGLPQPPDYGISAEVKIFLPVPAGFEDAATRRVINIMRDALASENVTVLPRTGGCNCGGHHSEGGDPA